MTRREQVEEEEKMSHYCPACNEQHCGQNDVCDRCEGEIQAQQYEARAQQEAEAQAYEQYQSDRTQGEFEAQQGGPEG